VVLGFALNNDITKLQQFMNDADQDLLLHHASVLDFQLLYSDRAQLPGLSKCVQYFSKKELDKTLQCSDWSHRPLTKAQLAYAALDAAVLLYLMAEETRKRPFDNELEVFRLS
jgi:ribonuclease D